MNAIDFLTAQHRVLEGMFTEVLDGDDVEKGVLVFQKLGDHLTTHLISEEQIFYPAVRAERTEDILLESLEEHLSLKRLLADLLVLASKAQTFIPKFKVLSEQTIHHHKEEEDHLFPKVRSARSNDKLEALGQEMAQLQLRLQREGAPRETVAGQTSTAEPLKGESH
jgi:hemerythrin superfamily protein